jgi:type II secretion system protein J
MRRSTQNAAGFTLVEVMIVAALTLMAVSLSISSFLTLARASTSASAYAHMHAELRHAMDVLERDIRAGISVSGSDQANSSRITLQVKTISGDEQIVYYTYGTTLYRRQGGQARELANGLSSVNFTLLDANGAATTSANANTIEIVLKGSARILSNTCEDILQTRVQMRNKDV